ncbi:MAG: murein biosynthesis integral membrane protein MurJ [Armatimonadetes bacterium]|nr:murein biosynthesis integral membrane protein MurJ [Armatimonadota bacterium]
MALRTMLFAWRFGAEGPPNAFFQALRVPDLVYFLIAGGALRAGFVPVFTEMWARGERERAWRTFSSLLWFLVVFGGCVVVLGVVFAPQLAVVVGPGWAKEHPELLPLCAKLMRLMFPAQLFFVLGGLLMGTLNALQHFLWPGLGPIIYNCVIIAGILVAAGPEEIWVVAATVPLGALAGNLLVQVPPLRRLGARLLFVFDLSDEGLRKTLALAAPVIFGLAVTELNFVFTSILATLSDPDRGPAVLQYANWLWRTPTRVFGAGIAIALFPSLAYHFAKNATDAFRRDFILAARAALFTSAPTFVLLAVMRRPLIEVLYERGRFAAGDVAAVSETLLMYSLGIVPLTLYYLVARAFYARHDTRTPVVVGILSLIACVALGWSLMKPLGVPGLALATSAASAINTAVLWYILARRMGGVGTSQLAQLTVRLVPPLAAMGICCALGVQLTRQVTYGTLFARFAGLAVGAGVGGAAYLAVSYALGLPELDMAIAVFRRRRPGAADVTEG